MGERVCKFFLILSAVIWVLLVFYSISSLYYKYSYPTYTNILSLPNSKSHSLTNTTEIIPFVAKLYISLDVSAQVRAEHQRDLELQHGENARVRAEQQKRVRAEQQKNLELKHEDNRCDRELKREQLADVREVRNAKREDQREIRTIEREKSARREAQDFQSREAALDRAAKTGQFKASEAPADGLGELHAPADGLGEEPVASDGLGEEPVAADGLGEEPVDADGLGEEPVAVDGLGEDQEVRNRE